MSDVLFVCTGNLCRSPSAEFFLERELQRGGPTDITVSSAGTLGTSSPVPDRLRKEGAAFELDLTGHRPRRMQVEDVSQAQLVIGMARQHVREAVLLDRNSFPRAFTLRELVRRGTELGPREPDESLQDWLVRVQGLRRLLDLVGDYGPDDIPDPLGGSSEAYRRMLIDVRALVNDLYSLIWA